MRLQHLKDLIGRSSDSDNNVFLSALSSLLMLVLDERTPPSIHPYFFGAPLFALDKNDRGVSAIGCTLRHLAAKVAMNNVLVEMADLLVPDQLGFGVSGGAEAAVNSGRLYLHNIDPHQVLLKLDFMNPFNSVCRDKLLAAVHDLAPDLFPFVHSSYFSSTSPFWGDKILQSQEGIQQGDPLGLLFFVFFFSRSTLLKSEFHVFYLDDISP